ncbi:MAG TPA: glycosyltransferase family 2 protein [Miltoncostaeaceae bacterium]|nr:glycosyltransferase family 2 protein [Miltoncostaeaceae bacterium]
MEDVVVVDGSDDGIFDVHARRWRPAVRHVRPHGDLRFASGKVNGVISGVREASCERLIVADDDVRYDDASLRRMLRLLEAADVVCPQNHFDPLPWHAVWDTGRILIARAVGHDMPGTLGVRRARFLEMGGYDGDVLFENLELLRTVRAAGGRVVAPRDLYVRRLPPTAAHFWSQRVRQAYDEFARPLRMAAALALLPAVAASRRPAAAAAAVAALAVAAAEGGRRRAGGRRVFPARTSLAAPAWVAERAVCAWLAVGLRALRGGVPYGGTVMRRAATPSRRLRRARARS